MKKIQCARCEQVFWTELLGIDERLIASGEWIKCACPRCAGEWAILEPAAKRPRALRRKAKPAAKRRRGPKEAGGEKPVGFTPARIRSMRRRLGLSQGELAALIGVNRATANMWERGKTRPKEDKTARLAGLAGMGKDEVRKLLAEKVPHSDERSPEEAQGKGSKEGRKGGKAARKAGKKTVKEEI